MLYNYKSNYTDYKFHFTSHEILSKFLSYNCIKVSFLNINIEFDIFYHSCYKEITQITYDFAGFSNNRKIHNNC